MAAAACSPPISARDASQPLSTSADASSTIPPNAEHRWAAVALLLREGKQGEELLLIERAQRMGDPWSGHMAFPGGRYETQDASLLNTAIRETQEELNLDLNQTAICAGQLEDTRTLQARRDHAHTMIRPFVFRLQPNCDHALARIPPWPTHSDSPLNDEVNRAFWCSLVQLQQGNKEGSITVPALGKAIWGATHRMVEMLFHYLSTTS